MPLRAGYVLRLAVSLQGTRYVWNLEQLMQASQDPAVTRLMGNTLVLPWHLSEGLRWSLYVCQQHPYPELGCHCEFLCPSGLFEPAEMKYDVNRNVSADPSLAEMTEVAVRLLSRNPQGFYLFVEGEWLCGAEKRRGKGS